MRRRQARLWRPDRQRRTASSTWRAAWGRAWRTCGNCWNRADSIDRASSCSGSWAIRLPPPQATSPSTNCEFDCPIRQPEKILCIGVNYAERNEEYKDGTAAPSYPSVFPRFARSFVGHGRAIRRPPESTQLDYEGEIAIVIGKGGRRIPRSQALSHIAGLTCLNEGTIRDWVRHGKFNVTQGKNWDDSGAIGPWLVTADEFADMGALTVTTRVNGETRQHDTTARLMFPFDALISYLSTWTTLVPGDVIATGTPTGAGVRFDPPKFLGAGRYGGGRSQRCGRAAQPGGGRAVRPC